MKLSEGLRNVLEVKKIKSWLLDASFLIFYLFFFILIFIFYAPQIGQAFGAQAVGLSAGSCV